jgi:hypothetical protein
MPIERSPAEPCAKGAKAISGNFRFFPVAADRLSRRPPPDASYLFYFHRLTAIYGRASLNWNSRTPETVQPYVMMYLLEGE